MSKRPLPYDPPPSIAELEASAARSDLPPFTAELTRLLDVRPAATYPFAISPIACLSS